MGQNLLNFLPVGEHEEVFKVLSSHPDIENLNSDYLKCEYPTPNPLSDICFAVVFFTAS